jgi:RimJ/RimL family protein N-acetyltransferase
MDFRFVPVILDNDQGLFQYHAVYQYWQDIIASGLIKYRIPEVKGPTIQNVMTMLYDRSFCHIAVWDTKENQVAGECALYHFVGRSALMHYSVHPSYHGNIGAVMCLEALEQIFTYPMPPLNLPLTAIRGISPVTNRLSINFLKKIGFSVKCILTDSFTLAYKDNQVVDGVLVEIHGELSLIHI